MWTTVLQQSKTCHQCKSSNVDREGERLLQGSDGHSSEDEISQVQHWGRMEKRKAITETASCIHSSDHPVVFCAHPVADQHTPVDHTSHQMRLTSDIHTSRYISCSILLQLFFVNYDSTSYYSKASTISHQQDTLHLVMCCNQSCLSRKQKKRSNINNFRLSNVMFCSSQFLLDP